MPWRALPQDPTGGDLYVFVSRSGRQIKVLYFDRSGWCVWAKRLEAGRFISDWSKARTHEIDCTGLKMLLEGIEPRRYLKRYRHGDSRDPQHERQVVNSEGVPCTQGNSEHSRGAQLTASVA
jgi:transposase